MHPNKPTSEWGCGTGPQHDAPTTTTMFIVMWLIVLKAVLQFQQNKAQNSGTQLYFSEKTHIGFDVPFFKSEGTSPDGHYHAETA